MVCLEGSVGCVTGMDESPRLDISELMGCHACSFHFQNAHTAREIRCKEHKEFWRGIRFECPSKIKVAAITNSCRIGEGRNRGRAKDQGKPMLTALIMELDDESA